MTGPFRTLAVVSVALLLAGCPGSLAPKKSTEPLAPQYRFEDVPVHPKLKIDSRESFIFETRSLKAGILVYHGGESVTEVVEFFKAEMPKHAWRLINAIEAKGIASMNFDKEGWSALIRVSRSPLTTDVEITIGPKDAGAPVLRAPGK